MRPVNTLVFMAFCPILLLAGCQSSTMADVATGVSAAPERAYPNINIVPTGETAQITPAEEMAMLASLNAELASRPVLTAAELALIAQRKQRMAELARTNRQTVEGQIDAR